MSVQKAVCSKSVQKSIFTIALYIIVKLPHKRTKTASYAINIQQINRTENIECTELPVMVIEWFASSSKLQENLSGPCNQCTFAITPQHGTIRHRTTLGPMVQQHKGLQHRNNNTYPVNFSKLWEFYSDSMQDRANISTQIKFN